MLSRDRIKGIWMNFFSDATLTCMYILAAVTALPSVVSQE